MKQRIENSKKRWLKNREQVVPNSILLATVILILILTLLGGLGQKAVTEQRIEMISKQLAYKY